MPGACARARRPRRTRAPAVLPGPLGLERARLRVVFELGGTVTAAVACWLCNRGCASVVTRYVTMHLYLNVVAVYFKLFWPLKLAHCARSTARRAARTTARRRCWRGVSGRGPSSVQPAPSTPKSARLKPERKVWSQSHRAPAETVSLTPCMRFATVLMLHHAISVHRALPFNPIGSCSEV